MHAARNRFLLPLKLTGTLSALALALWACNSHPLQAPTPAPEAQTNQNFMLNPAREVDVLFLVDKSPTMRDEQASLAQNFPRFIEVLENIKGGMPDLHLGVITQDMGAGGYEQQMGGLGEVARPSRTTAVACATSPWCRDAPRPTAGSFETWPAPTGPGTATTAARSPRRSPASPRSGRTAAASSSTCSRWSRRSMALCRKTPASSVPTPTWPS